jgi:hypothetical protein
VAERACVVGEDDAGGNTARAAFEVDELLRAEQVRDGETAFNSNQNEPGKTHKISEYFTLAQQEEKVFTDITL